MEFLFFAADDSRLFTRSDAESATWTVEEMSLHALFPFDPNKRITRGMRIGFVDATGVFQPFEIRKVKTYEPDHYQEITAEHIVVAELSDEHLPQTELTEMTASNALGLIVVNTLWNFGSTTASNTSSVDLSTGSVWQGVRSIEQNWNVYITPNVVFDDTGIIGRFLDIVPAAPTWNGVRLSLDKNADEVGVTWDDTNVITAIYGYGANVENTAGDDTEILTFEDVVWSATSAHPAKPANQKYLEDPTATALYGRNGRPRYGYYQNSNIGPTDTITKAQAAEILLEKSWEALKASNAPDVSIECQVRDLYRLGYADQPLQLHDSAIIEIRPTGETLQREIIRLTVDLLDPTATRVTIGSYIPNIVYLQRDTQVAATGDGGGGNHSSTGKQGNTGQNNKTYEFQTRIQANQYQINLVAEHTDENSNILQQAGLSLDAYGVLIYATDNDNMWQSKLNVQAERIGLVVSGTGTNAEIKAAEIVAAINGTESSVTISADKIYLFGETTIDNLLTGHAKATALWSTLLQADETFNFQHHNAKWQTFTFVDGLGTPTTATFLIQQNAARNAAEEQEER